MHIILQAGFYPVQAIEIPKGGANGVAFSQGGMFGGWSFYVSLVFDFDYDGGRLNCGGTGTILINGKKVGQVGSVRQWGRFTL